MYYAAVGLFREEYRNIDYIRSIAYGEAYGKTSDKFIPVYCGK